MEIEGDSMSNIDLFNLIVAEIFSRLYKSFPVGIEYRYEEVALKIMNDVNLDAQDYDEKRRVGKVVFYSNLWLKKSGYIYAQGDEFSSRSATLTAKALESLYRIPEGLESQDSIGSMLAKGTSNLGKDLTIHLIKQGLSSAVKLITGQFS